MIPTEDLAVDFINRGLPEEKLYPFGIPTHSKFAARENRDAVKRRLGLDTAKKYILITGGSMGGGKIEKTITKLRLYFEDQQDIDTNFDTN